MVPDRDDRRTRAGKRGSVCEEFLEGRDMSATGPLGSGEETPSRGTEVDAEPFQVPATSDAQVLVRGPIGPRRE